MLYIVIFYIDIGWCFGCSVWHSCIAVWCFVSFNILSIEIGTKFQHQSLIIWDPLWCMAMYMLNACTCRSVDDGNLCFSL